MPEILLGSIIIYFLALLGLSFLVGKDSRNSSFFMARRRSPWFIVSFGMLGASISGITFISVPGWVLTNGFSYLQMVFGFILGYLFIAFVLLPLFYKLKLTSIYSYLEIRFGKTAYKTSATIFLISKLISTASILYVIVNIIHHTISELYHIPFSVSVFVVISLIYLYTFRSGMLTIVWTDVFQTTFMLLAVILTIIAIYTSMHWSSYKVYQEISNSEFSTIFHFENLRSTQFFWKSFIAGIFIPIAMTGLDQDKMQKNLTCKTLGEAQKNMILSGLAFTPVNLLFLILGISLIFFSNANGLVLPQKTDDLFTNVIASGLLPNYTAIIFILGLIAATYSSADSAITAMTTSFCVDIVNISSDTKQDKRKRILIHLGLSFVLALVVIGINHIQIKTILDTFYKIVSYTYGPLLGLFFFGLFTKHQSRDKAIPYLAASSILLSFGIEYTLNLLFHYQVSYELLIVNGLITFVSLWLFTIPKNKSI